MSIKIIDPVYTTKYIGPCQITLFDRNDTPITVIDAPEKAEPALQINDKVITIKIFEGCRAEKDYGTFPDGLYIKVSYKGQRYGYIIR
ncbi:uncharacterized protein PgNI_02686 [Pyricularia grisea]|uniref:Uncharacterized protein n=1 Tax=Pyricularia grisea TaxID=148305 RepID=A0A6P8BBA4_PYRGI|nr:uncharacterized protein PgNI_02686 [Pyricularia grisea]TLD13121.1 hypothetical protein PgNI_02686 [Pyricularia grisea]